MYEQEEKHNKYYDVSYGVKVTREEAAKMTHILAEKRLKGQKSKVRGTHNCKIADIIREAIEQYLERYDEKLKKEKKNEESEIT